MAVAGTVVVVVVVAVVVVDTVVDDVELESGLVTTLELADWNESCTRWLAAGTGELLRLWLSAAEGNANA